MGLLRPLLPWAVEQLPYIPPLADIEGVRCAQTARAAACVGVVGLASGVNQYIFLNLGQPLVHASQLPRGSIKLVPLCTPER